MRIRHRSLIIMFSHGLNQATVVLLGVILVRLIDPTTLGTYRQAILVYNFVASIVAIEMGTSLYYFLPKLGLEDRARLMSQTFAITLGLAALVAVVLLVGADGIAQRFNNPPLATCLRIMAVYPFFERLLVMVPSFMISLDLAARAAVYSIIVTAGRIGLVTVVFALRSDVPDALWATVALGAVVAAVAVADMVRRSGPGAWRLDGQLMREQLHYVWPLWVNVLMGAINAQFGSLVISSFFDAATFAVYSCGAIELPLISLVTSSVSAATLPNLVSLVASGREKDALALWHEAIRKSSLVILPSFAFCLLLSRDIIVLLYGPPFEKAAWPFAIYLLELPLRVAVYATMFRAMGATRPIAVSTFIALAVNLALSPTLTWLGWGTLLSFIGPAIGTVCATFVWVAYMLWRIKGLVGVRFSQVMRWGQLGRLLALSLLCALAAHGVVRALPAMPLPVRIGTEAALYAAILIPAMFLLKMLQKDELEMIASPLRLVRRWSSARRGAP